MWGYWQVTFSSLLSLVSKVETTSSGTPASSSFFTHMWEVSSLRHDRKAIPSSDIFFFTTLNSSSSSPSSFKAFLQVPCGLHVQLHGFVCLAEGKNPLKGILSEAHVDVRLPPVLLDVICSLSDAGVQGNIGEELKTSAYFFLSTNLHQARSS